MLMIRRRKLEALGIRLFIVPGRLRPEKARLLLEEIRGRDEFQPGVKGMLQKMGVPERTVGWLSSLSPEEKAALRIVSNQRLEKLMADTIAWKALGSAGSIATDTLLAYPAPGEEMPGRIECNDLEDPFLAVRRVINTWKYRGLKGAALLFDDFTIEERKRGDVRTVIYKPEGPATVIEGFPQDSAWWSCPSGLLTPPYEAKFIARAPLGQWVGQIARPISTSGCSWSGTLCQSHNRHPDPEQLIDIRWSSHSTFAHLIELPAHGIGRSIEPPELLLPGVLQEIPLSQDMLAQTKSLVRGLTLRLMADPGLAVALDDLVGDFSDIAIGSPLLQAELRREVSKITDWEYMQSGRPYSIDEWHRIYSSICRSLGIPLLKDLS